MGAESPGPSRRPVPVSPGFAVIGFVIGQWRAHLADRDLRRTLLQQAAELAQTIPTPYIEALSFSDADGQKPQFRRLHRWLSDYQSEIVCRASGAWLGATDAWFSGPSRMRRTTPRPHRPAPSTNSLPT